jgi:pilus assembly protein CpaE
MMRSGSNAGDNQIITILLVDDIPETRENIKKLLTFEPDFKVIGSVGTGRDGVNMARELKPNIIIMDINMPDMDGIQATALINETTPTCAVIMMSVQNDPDYLRRAMLAGARNFLTKPILPDELYNTIRVVHEQQKRQNQNIRTDMDIANEAERRKSQTTALGGDDVRAGNIIVVYSPSGGIGCTTVATNIASGLMREGNRTLLVDADLQFGDVGVFLNLQSQTTIVDMMNNIEDLDIEFFDNILVSHPSGLKVLLGPPRPEQAEEVHQTNPLAVSAIIQKVANNYDFVVVDTGRYLSENLLSLFDIAHKVVMVATPNLSCIKNVRFVLDLFDKLSYPPEKAMLVLNKVTADRNLQRLMIPTERIEKFLKRPVEVEIPDEPLAVATAISKGVLIVAQRDRSKSPVKELMQLSDLLYTRLMGSETEVAQDEKVKKRTGLGGLRFGKG